MFIRILPVNRGLPSYRTKQVNINGYYSLKVFIPLDLFQNFLQPQNCMFLRLYIINQHKLTAVKRNIILLFLQLCFCIQPSFLWNPLKKFKRKNLPREVTYLDNTVHLFAREQRASWRARNREDRLGWCCVEKFRELLNLKTLYWAGQEER